MKQPIDFYFDFSSPYGYIAASRIEALAARHGRAVSWRPVLLGVVFKTTGSVPLSSIPLKAEYARRDFERSARFHGVPYRHPSVFPISALVPSRAFYWLRAHNPGRENELAKNLFHAYFVEDIDISGLTATAQICRSVGVDPAEVTAALQSQTVKDLLRAEVQQSIDRGVFGSPFIVVDGEPFWGVDRFDQVDEWLASGGW